MYSVTQTSIAPLRLVEKGIFTVSVKLFCIKMKQPNQRVDAIQDLISKSRLDHVPVAPEQLETRLGKYCGVWVCMHFTYKLLDDGFPFFNCPFSFVLSS